MSNALTTVVVGVDDVAGNKHMSIAPNPTTGIVKIALDEPVRKIEVYSLVGAKMISATGDGEKQAIIYVDILPAGMYLLKVNDTYNATFMKQ